jgi:DHA1 family tetracycline resistance protein-like MFS transporter
LLGSQLASLAAYLLIAAANGVPMLFLSRAIEGLGGGNLGVANAYIADLTTPDERPRAFAFATAAFGAGFVVGPILGGILSRYGFVVPFLAAATLQAINMVLTATLLLGVRDRGAPTCRADTGPSAALRAILATPGIASVLARRFCYIFAFTSFFTTFSLYLRAVFDLGAEASSGLLALAGAVGAVTQIFFVAPLAKRYGLRRVALGAFALGFVAYAALGFARDVVAFGAVVAAWALSGSLLRPVLDSRIAELAPVERRGTILGYGDALDNASLIFAPPLAAAVVGFAPRYVGVLPGLSLAIGGVLAWTDVRRG